MAGSRCVEVAVDAAGGAGGRTYTYRVPPALENVVSGEAVIVEFGRRQALGIVLADVDAPAGVVLKPLLERVRSDGPLLPSLTLALARWMTAHYLAPAAMVVRAMLPPGLLERSELRAWAVPEIVPERLPERAIEALRAAGERGLAVRALPAPAGGRAALLRTLRAEAAAGRIELAWTIRPAEARPRLLRWARLTGPGRAAAAAAGRVGPEAAGGGGRLGVRQRAVLAELWVAEQGEGSGAATPGEGLPAPVLAARHGGGALTSLARRGLVVLPTAVVERRPLAARGTRVAVARPAGADLSPGQQAAVEAIGAAIAARNGGAFLLEGATAAGKTAVHVTAARAALDERRGALFLVPEIALAAPAPRSATDRARRARRAAPRRPRRGRARGRVAPHPARRGARRGGHAHGHPGAARGRGARSSSTRSTIRPTRRTARRASRLATRPWSWAVWRAPPVVLGSATPDVVTWAQARAGLLGHLQLRERIVGRMPQVELVDLRAELAAGNRSLLSRSLRAALDGLDLAAGERAILVLNRRGSASVVVCRDCGYVQVCPDCQRPLVYHAAGRVLRCHHCGATAPLARSAARPVARRASATWGAARSGSRRRCAQRCRACAWAVWTATWCATRGPPERVLDAFTDGRWTCWWAPAS